MAPRLVDCGRCGKNRHHHARGLCHNCYRYLREMGRPMPPKTRKAYERWSALVDRSDTAACWPWPGTVRANGYPNHSIYRRAYTDHHGSVPEGMVVDHNCHNLDRSCRAGDRCPHRRCVNPNHLRAVTQLVNTRSSPATNATKTHCPRGHPLEPGNLYINNRGQRVCRTCQLEAVRKQRLRQVGTGPVGSPSQLHSNVS